MKHCRIAGWFIAGCLAFVPAARGQEPSLTHGFSVVLLLGDGAAGPPPTGLSESARKAIGDIQGFLPYKSYHLLDDQWVVANDNTVKANAKLSGVDGQRLVLDLRAARQQNGRLAVTFRLERDDPAGASAAGLPPVADLLADARSIEDELMRMLERYGARHPAVLQKQKQLREIQHKVNSAHTAASLIDTQFTVTPGETVVVGTSRIVGDKALIVLLTAVPRGATPTAAADQIRVYLTGYVRNAGSYSVAEGTTVGQAIVLAGGLAERGSDRNIEIKRLSDGKPTTISATLDTRLQANDVVRIPARSQ